MTISVLIICDSRSDLSLFFFQAEDGIRDWSVTGVQTCALPIYPVKDRLNQHYSKKDFWDRAMFFAAKDDSLNKAHVQWLEARLLTRARMAKLCNIDNNQEPLLPSCRRPTRPSWRVFCKTSSAFSPCLV